MGFDISGTRTIYKLRFTEPYEGLEIDTRAPTFEELLTIAPLADVADRKQMTSSDLEPVMTQFAGMITRWNLEDEGKSLKPSADLLMAMDFGFLMNLLQTWMGRVTAVAPPLPGGSGSGPAKTERHLDLPMESPETESPGS